MSGFVILIFTLLFINIIVRILLLKLFYNNEGVEYFVFKINKHKNKGGPNIGWISKKEVNCTENLKLRYYLNLSSITLFIIIIIMVLLGILLSPTK